MKWTFLAPAALLQLGLSGVSLASFDGSSIGSVEDLLGARAELANVDFTATLGRRQAGGRCGADGGGAICSGNLCCSAFGYCGDGDTYCPQIVGCQTAFGWCEGEPLPSPSSPATPTSTSTSTRTTPTSTSTSTTPTSTSTSTTSSTISTTPPPTTSSTSSTSSSLSPTATSTSPPYTGPLTITQNGMCGNATTCAGSRFGSCCSQFYYCGNDASFCGGGCQSQFGSCGVAGGVSTITITSTITSSVTVTIGASGVPITATATITQTVTSILSSVTTVTVGGTTVSVTTAPTSSSTTPIVTPTPTTSTTSRTTTSSTSAPSVTIPAGLRSSTDGTCGDGVTCLGSGGGQCCSQWGFCGDERQFCVQLLGCQPQFGICTS